MPIFSIFAMVLSIFRSGRQAGIVGGSIVAAAAISTAFIIGGRQVGEPLDNSDPFGVNDNFDAGDSDPANRGWSWFQESLVSTQTVSGGDLNLEPNAGGAGGSFWFDANDGFQLYKSITGPFDCRTKVRVRNSAGTSNPPVTNFRIAGISVHDPAGRPPFNYVHIGLGSTASGSNSVEWKTTDASDSAFSFAAWPPTGTDLDGDLRIVRTEADDQVFELYHRDYTLGLGLTDDTNWTLFITIDRTDAAVPNRGAFGGSTAVALPSTVDVGFMVYASTVSHDIQLFAEDFVCLEAAA